MCVCVCVCVGLIPILGNAPHMWGIRRSPYFNWLCVVLMVGARMVGCFQLTF